MVTPAIRYVDGIRLARGLTAGIQRVVADRDYLNKINVYPVADSDTGTNMAYTLNSVLARLRERNGRHAGRLLTDVADAALDGARGNSGAILAQFFQGLGDTLEGRARLTVTDLANAVRTGSQYAYEALSEPREGTILTVIADYAAALAAHVGGAHDGDIASLLESGLGRARTSLANTPNLLDVLRKAGVVDAAAQGFVDLLEGIHEFIASGSLRASGGEAPRLRDEHVEAAAGGEEIDREYRYCTECLVTGLGIERRLLRERLAELGRSLVIAGTRNKVRVHIHTNAPGGVFQVAEAFGALSGQKADDMVEQQLLTHAERRHVAIVTDTACDIPDEELERLGIHIVSLRVLFGERSYLDRITLSQEEFFRELRENPLHPTTSQPAPGDLRRLFDFLGSHYRHVVSIHISGWASGTLQAALSAAARASGDGRVLVVDSMNASLGQGLLVTYAAECAHAGYSGPEVMAAVEAMRAKTLTLGVLRDLTFGVRGGRLPAYVKATADALRLTPVLRSWPTGKIAAGGVLLGRTNVVTKFARFVLRRITPAKTYRVAVGHAEAPADAEALLEALRGGIPNLHSAFVTTIGTALGVHGGPGLLVVGLQEYTPPARRVEPHEA